MLGKKAKTKRKSKRKKIMNTKRNHYNKVSRSKSVNNNHKLGGTYNNRKKLEKRINFYRVQNICNHFQRQNSANRRREFNNCTPVHKKNQSINEGLKNNSLIGKPSKTVRHGEKEKRTKSKSRKGNKRKNKLSVNKDNLNQRFDINEGVKNLMNSNRIIEPFSPTFEHPDDFLPSHQASFRHQLMARNKVSNNIYKTI
jgi:hypothetical protein